MDIKTSATRDGAHSATPPRDGGAHLLLTASASASYYRAAAQSAKTLQALTTTPRLKRYFGALIDLFDGRAADIEASGKPVCTRSR